MICISDVVIRYREFCFFISILQSLKGYSPVGVLALGGAAEPATHAHAGEAGLHNIGIVGRAALPVGANAAGRANRTCGADLTAGRHAAVVERPARHKALTACIGGSTQATVHRQRGQTSCCAHSIDVFLHSPVGTVRAVDAPPLLTARRRKAVRW